MINYSDLVIHMTYSCNMSCSFCVEKEKLDAKNVLTIDERLEKITHLLNTNTYDCIGISGGEPLLYKEDLKKIILAIRQNKNNTNALISVFTNSSLLTLDIVDFFNTYNITVVIALQKISAGEKSLHSAMSVGKNINLDFLINRIKNKRITKVIYPQKEFAADLIEMAALFYENTSYQIALNHYSNFTMVDVEFIATELQKLKIFPCFDKIKFRLTHRVCSQECNILYETGLYEHYPCEDIDGWDGCSDLINRFPDIKTAIHYVELCEKYNKSSKE